MTLNPSHPHLHPDWLLPQWPAPNRVKAVCTTRSGGRSKAPWNDLNLGNHVGDDPTDVARNREVLQHGIGARSVFMEQVHGSRMLAIDSTVDAAGAHDIPGHWVADGAVTQQTGVACTVMVADCLPVLLCDTQGLQVAIAHAGWRGLAGQGGSGILEEAVKCFWPLDPVPYTQNATKLIAWLGPCIGPKAFEVGEEVRIAFVSQNPQAAACFEPVGRNTWLADLPGLARLRLQVLGVVGIYGNDGSDGWCTVGNPSRFFSHRRDRISGRQAACIWLE